MAELTNKESKSSTNDLICNMCETQMEYTSFNGTHIWNCVDCPNLQLEFIDMKDAKNLVRFLLQPISD